MTIFKKAAKPVCEELVATTSQEISYRIDQKVDATYDILEVGIMAVALIASFVLPKNPLTMAAREVLKIPLGVTIEEFSRF